MILCSYFVYWYFAQKKKLLQITHQYCIYKICTNIEQKKKNFNCSNWYTVATLWEIGNSFAFAFSLSLTFSLLSLSISVCYWRLRQKWFRCVCSLANITLDVHSIENSQKKTTKWKEKNIRIRLSKIKWCACSIIIRKWKKVGI